MAKFLKEQQIFGTLSRALTEVYFRSRLSSVSPVPSLEEDPVYPDRETDEEDVGKPKYSKSLIICSPKFHGNLHRLCGGAN